MKDEDKKPEAHHEHEKPHEAAKPAPVMDVKPPHPAESHEAAPAQGVKSEPMPIKEPPPPEAGPAPKGDSPTSLIQNEIDKGQAAKAAAPKPTKPPKQPGSGVGMAIAGTVIIVIVLAGLAVYAYLQSK